MVLVELLEVLALATWLVAIGWRATDHGPRRGRFAHRPPENPPPDHGRAGNGSPDPPLDANSLHEPVAGLAR